MQNYDWLKKEGSPKMIVEALKLLGTVETPGDKSNPIILGWGKELRISSVYTTDSIPWCGLFAAIVAARSGKRVPENPLWAANWRNFGTTAKIAKLGYVLTFSRTGGNHVSFYVGEDENYYHCLGGNQKDQVCFIRMLKSKCTGIRMPEYKIAEPANVRVIHLNSSGEVFDDKG